LLVSFESWCQLFGDAPRGSGAYRIAFLGGEFEKETNWESTEREKQGGHCSKRASIYARTPIFLLVVVKRPRISCQLQPEATLSDEGAISPYI